MKKQTVASSILWLTLAEILFNFSGYIIHSFLGRFLGPADYGRYGLTVNLTTTVVMLIGNGIPTAMSKYISGIFETKPGMVGIIKKQAALLQVVIIGLFTAIFYLAAPLFAKLLNDATLTPLFQISAFILPAFAAASFYLYYFIGIHRFNLQAVLKTIRSLARILFVIILAYFFGVKGTVVGYIISPTLVFLVAWIIDVFWIKRQFEGEEESFDWQQLLNYAWPVTLFMLFFQILTSLDLFMVKALLHDDRLTGIYNAALTLGYVPYYLFYALTMVMLPSISRTTAQENHGESASIIERTFRMMVMILIPLATCMIIYAGPIVQLFFGQRFIEAVPPFQILTLGISFLAIFYVMSFALNGSGRIMLPMYISLAGLILNGVLNYFFVMRLGINGSAIATSITAILITLVILVYIYKHFKVLMAFEKFAKFLVAGIVMYAISYFFPPQKWIFVLWSVALGGIYVGVLMLLGEFTKKDINFFRQIISRKKGEE